LPGAVSHGHSLQWRRGHRIRLLVKLGLCDVPVQQSIPLFIIRHGKSKRSQRRSRSPWLPLYLSFSELGDDADMKRLLSPSTTTHTTTIQHRTLNTDIDIPQSLPTPSALVFGSGSPHLSISSDNIPTLTSISIPISIQTSPPHSFDSNSGDWTLIDPQHTTSQPPTPTISEPETWILIDDS